MKTYSLLPLFLLISCGDEFQSNLFSDNSFPDSGIIHNDSGRVQNMSGECPRGYKMEKEGGLDFCIPIFITTPETGGVFGNTGGSSGVNSGGQNNSVPDSGNLIPDSGPTVVDSGYEFDGSPQVNTGGVGNTKDASPNTGGTPSAGSGGISGIPDGGGNNCDFTLCDSVCKDTSSDDENCGGCGYVCVHGRHCQSGRCTPAWQPLSEDNAPNARMSFASSVLNNNYIVSGGSLDGAQSLSDSAEYNLQSDIWRALPPMNSVRCNHSSISTGKSIFVYGGLTNCSDGTTTGPGLEELSFDGKSYTWTNIVVNGEPTPKYAFTSVWTGSLFFIYGGASKTLPTSNSGSYFNPTNSSWQNFSCSISGCDRSEGFSFLDGNTVRIIGGAVNPVYPNPPTTISDAVSGISFVGKNSSNWNLPANSNSKKSNSCVDSGNRVYCLHGINQVTVYDKKSSNWVADDSSGMPPGLCIKGSTSWSGQELVVWSGQCNGAVSSVGGRYQPAY